MKNIAYLCLLALFFSSATLHAQTLAAKVAAAKILMAQAGYTVLDTRYCSLQKGKECYLSRNFYGGTDYVVVAVAEDGVKDLDLFAYNASGNKYSEDVSLGEVPALSIGLLFTSNLTIYIKNVDSYNSTYLYSTAILIGYK